MALIVQKFGGSSVRDVERMKEVARRVLEEKELGNQVVVVVSAMGKTTDNLIGMANELMEGPPEREMDMLLSTGEQISIAILAIAIHAAGHDAVSFTGPQVGIKTDGRHSRARIVHINDERIRRSLDKGRIVIVAGFQGATADEEITTLGRGGSDTTAVALAAALKADRCDIYTDVEGVYTADPRVVTNARMLDCITYDEMLELASLGAKVLHSRSVELAKKYHVPLRVRSSFSHAPGTLLVEEYKSMEDVIVSGVACNKDEVKVSMIGVPDRPGIAATIFGRIAEEGVSVDMIIQNVGEDGKNDISFTVHRNDLKKALACSEALKTELKADSVEHEEKIAKLSLVGVGMKSHSGVAARLFAVLAKHSINIKMISTSEISISCLIGLDQVETAMKAAHSEFGLDSASGEPVRIG